MNHLFVLHLPDLLSKVFCAFTIGQVYLEVASNEKLRAIL